MLISLQLTGFTFSACHHATLWALTPLISPLPTEVGSFVSVALSLRLPAVAVSDCHYPKLPGLSSCFKASDRLTNCSKSIIPRLCLLGRGSFVGIKGLIDHSVS